MCSCVFHAAGTPISHGGRADLMGLLKFLQVPHIPKGESGSAYRVPGVFDAGEVIVWVSIMVWYCVCNLWGTLQV